MPEQKQLSSQPLDLPKTTRTFKVVHLDEDALMPALVGTVIRRHFKNVQFRGFQNGDEAWEELLREDPDLLITDLMNDNDSGRKAGFARSGYDLLSLLAQRKVKYPILVVSGTLTKEGFEAKTRQIAGSDLNISFLKKPSWQQMPEQIYQELLKHIKPLDGKLISVGEHEEKRHPQHFATGTSRDAIAMKNNESWKLIKGLLIAGLLLYGGFRLLCPFDKKDTGPKTEYTIAYTTINGRRYDKFATPNDLYGDFVTFGDGTRVPRSAVTFKNETLSLEELTNAMKLYENALKEVPPNSHP
jgi:CheY-like chemotaxis protein